MSPAAKTMSRTVMEVGADALPFLHDRQPLPPPTGLIAAERGLYALGQGPHGGISSAV
ncbi:MAG: hypothetical protein ACRD0Q_01415 [Acidimicrobiales bacterium]